MSLEETEVMAHFRITTKEKEESKGQQTNFSPINARPSHSVNVMHMQRCNICGRSVLSFQNIISFIFKGSHHKA